MMSSDESREKIYELQKKFLKQKLFKIKNFLTKNISKLNFNAIVLVM